MRLTATYLFPLLMVLFTIGGVGRVGAQTYDADGLYTDTVFHDHVNRQAEDFVSAYSSRSISCRLSFGIGGSIGHCRMQWGA